MRYVEITNVSVRVATSETASRSVRVLNIFLQIKLYTMKILLFVIVIIVVLNINLNLSYIKNVAINHLSKISTFVLMYCFSIVRELWRKGVRKECKMHELR